MPRKKEDLVKSTVYLTRDQMRGLRALSESDERPVAVHIRRAVDRYLELMKSGKEDKE